MCWTDVRAGRLEGLGAEEILIWAIKNFHPRLALSCSFGNVEGLVLLDMMHRIEPSSRVYVLDTGRLHQATYDLIDRVRDRYGKDVEVVFPEAAAVQAMVRKHGMNLFYESLENRQLCCRLRKVEPNRRYLAELDAHVTGLRREQGVTRTEVRKVELEGDGSLVKINPLADWTLDEVCPLRARPHRSGESPPRRGLPQRRLRALHPRGAAGRRPALGPLVVGERGHAGVRPAHRGREGWLGHLGSRVAS